MSTWLPTKGKPNYPSLHFLSILIWQLFWAKPILKSSHKDSDPKCSIISLHECNGLLQYPIFPRIFTIHINTLNFIYNLDTWTIKKQYEGARSRAKAEYMAIEHGVCEPMGLNLLTELKFRASISKKPPKNNIAWGLFAYYQI